MAHKIKLTVSDCQLLEFKQYIEKMTKGNVTDPLTLLTILLQKECDNADVFADVVFDSGGNSIGDVLEEGEWDECFVEQQLDD